MLKKACMFIMGALLLGMAPAFAGDTLKVRASQDYLSSDAKITEPFNAIVVDGDVDVNFEQAREVSARVYGAENLVKLVRAEVKDGVLYVGFNRPVVIRGKKELQVRVTGPELNKITVSGKGEVDVKRGLVTDELFIQASDRGEVNVSGLEARNIRVEASGRADVSLERIVKAASLTARSADRAELEFSGTVNSADFENRGSEDIDAGDLRASSVKAVTYGRGDISCRASVELDAASYGWGKVEYEGFPERLTKSGKTHRIVRD